MEIDDSFWEDDPKPSKVSTIIEGDEDDISDIGAPPVDLKPSPRNKQLLQQLSKGTRQVFTSCAILDAPGRFGFRAEFGTNALTVKLVPGRELHDPPRIRAFLLEGWITSPRLRPGMKTVIRHQEHQVATGDFKGITGYLAWLSRAHHMLMQIEVSKFKVILDPKDCLPLEHLPLAMRTAWNLKKIGVDFEEAASEVEMYSPNMGWSFKALRGVCKIQRGDTKGGLVFDYREGVWKCGIKILTDNMNLAIEMTSLRDQFSFSDKDIPDVGTSAREEVAKKVTAVYVKLVFSFLWKYCTNKGLRNLDCI